AGSAFRFGGHDGQQLAFPFNFFAGLTEQLHMHHALDLLSGGGVESDNFAMPMWASETYGNELIVEIDVVGVLGFASGLFQAIDTGNASANQRRAIGGRPFNLRHRSASFTACWI